MKIYCVCGFCGSHSDEQASLEFNFRDMTVYFVCPSCKKENKIEMVKPLSPLPRTKTMR